MDRQHALQELAPAYAVALRLHATGAGAEVIAAALDIEVRAVPALIEVAEAKLRVILEPEPTPSGHDVPN